MKWIFGFIGAFLASALQAFEVPVDGGFSAASNEGLPAGWNWHEWDGYLPHSSVSLEPDGIVRISNVQGKDGSAIRSRRFSGRTGDVISVEVETCGSGTARLALYAWDKTTGWGWLFAVSSPNVEVGDEWKTLKHTFNVPTGKKPVEGLEVALVVSNGSDVRFRNLHVMRKLVRGNVIACEDFESPRVRSGNPSVVSVTIAPGLLMKTRQGVYRTNDRAKLVPKSTVRLPDGNDFLTSGFRLYALDGGRIVTRLADGDEFFGLAVHPSADGSELECRLSDGKGVKLPRAVLPADIALSVSAEGFYELSVMSLADSSVREVSGACAFFANRTNGVVRSVTLVSVGGGEASATVDDLILTESAPEGCGEISYPYTARPEAEFDPVKAGWPLVFSDEFEDDGVDNAKWQVGDSPERLEKVRRYSEVKDGKLRIKADYIPGTTNLATVGFTTREKFEYGYFEARLKFTTYNGWWAAFWAYSESVGNPFIDGMEIDIFEDYYMRNPARNTLDHNLHVNGAGPLKSWNYNSTLPGSYCDWYVIGCKWTPFEITYYLNGKAIASKAGHSPYKTVTFDAFRHAACIVPLNINVTGHIMSVPFGKHPPVPEETYPEAYEVDYVRIYGYPGAQEGRAPEVALKSSVSAFCQPEGSVLAFSAEAHPAAKSGSRIKAVHLFDDGYYLATVTEPPYAFSVPLTEAYFAKTAWSRSGRSGERPEFGGSFHVFCAFAEDESGQVGHSGTVKALVVPTKPSTPYQGRPQTIPGVLKVGHFDEGGAGIAYVDSTVANHGSKTWRTDEGVDATEDDVGNVSTGEWINYTVDVAQPGTYRVRIKYGTPQAGINRLDLILDGELVGTFDSLQPANSRSWAIDSESEVTVELPVGRHVLKLLIFGAYNFGNLTFEHVDKN